MADKLKFEIIEELIVLSENAKGWRKELNRVSWNDAEPKYDIRTWSPDHEKMGKGITLSEEEFALVSDKSDSTIQFKFKILELFNKSNISTAKNN